MEREKEGGAQKGREEERAIQRKKKDESKDPY